MNILTPVSLPKYDTENGRFIKSLPVLLCISLWHVFFSSDIGQESLNLSIWHNITLVEITKRGCEFAVRTSKLRDYDLGEFCVWSFNINGILQFIIISMTYIMRYDYIW